MSERSEADVALFYESDTPMQKITNKKGMAAIRRTRQSGGTVFFAIRRFALFWGRMNFIAPGGYRETLSVIDSLAAQRAHMLTARY